MQKENSQKHIKISKFLSLVLRHDPQSIGLALDQQGWAPVDDLIDKARAHRMLFDRETLFAVVASSDKKRFTLSEDKTRIRAAQGHSVTVDLGLQPVEPPIKLFHGTATSAIDAILAEGLKPGRRQQVHLSADEGTAVKVGMRHGKPVVLTVDAAAMARDGLLFWQAENGVWLTDTVPVRYLSLS